MKITIKTPFFPTESKEKIINALEKIFQIDFKINNREVYAETEKIESLALIKQKIADARIKNTVLYLLEKNRDGKNSTLELNKQTFLKGKIHFFEEKYPLGNVTIQFDDVSTIAMYFSN